MMHGTVTFFDARHGYGFITVDSLDYAVFVHVSAIVRSFVPHLRVGQRVAFDLVTDLQAPRAVNVTLAHRSPCKAPRHPDGLGAALRGKGCSGPIRDTDKETTDTWRRSTAQSGYSYTVSRVLDRPVTKVWEVWTRPDHFAQWRNASLSSISFDMRPGGFWQAVVVAPDGTELPMSGYYREVTKHRRLRFTVNIPGYAELVVLDIAFTDLGNQTKIVFARTSATDEEHEQARAGHERALEGVSAYLATV